MEFYTLAALKEQAQGNSLLQWGVTAVLLATMLVLAWQFSRHRFDTKYRDIGIILFLCVLFLIGNKVDDYPQAIDSLDASSHMVGFVQKVSEKEGFDPSGISVNAKRLYSGMLLKYEDQMYTVQFDKNFSAYQLQPVKYLPDDVKIVDKKETH